MLKEVRPGNAKCATTQSAFDDERVEERFLSSKTNYPRRVDSREIGVTRFARVKEGRLWRLHETGENRT